MKTFFRTLIIFIIAVFGYQFFFANNKKDVIDKQKMDSHNCDSIPNDYLRLIKLSIESLKTSKDIHFINSVYSKYRNPITRFYYKEKYYLQIYRIADSLARPLTQSLHISIMSSTAPQNEYYFLDDQTSFKYLYNTNTTSRWKNVFLNLYGDDVRTLEKKDNKQHLLLQCRNFSIKYLKGASDDIFGEANNGIINNRVSFELLFLKKGSSLYLIMLSSKDGNENFTYSILDDIVVAN